MTGMPRMDWRSHARLAAFVAAFALIALPIVSRPANAFWIGFGAPFPYYGYGPYWGYPAPYYPPPPPAYYPPPPGPTAYAPAAPGYGVAAPTAAPAAATTTPAITYTKKPAFTNSVGQSCREYKTTDGSHDVFGTACKQADGQWRVTN
jgi:hypothetical protein